MVKLSPSDVPSLGKQKGKELTVGMPRRLKRKVGEGILGVVADLWKLEFFAYELDRQVMVTDSSQDHDTSMPLVPSCCLMMSLPLMRRLQT